MMGFGRTGFAGAFFAFPVPPKDLEDFVKAVRVLPIHGVAVTIPHKQSIMALLDEVTPFAEAVGAVNTLFWQDGKLMGDNTDVFGFLSPLKERGLRPASAMVLGAGGAARAVVAGLKELGVAEIFIANRTHEKAQDLAAFFKVTALPWDERGKASAELIVNTTALGMAGEGQELSPWPAGGFGGVKTAYDIVYNPLHTVFLKDAARAGVDTIDGLSMFVGQARQQFRIWTGGELPADEARTYLLEALSLA
jgi:shikimate dehydrogenase